MLELYHIDRNNRLQENQTITLFNDYSLNFGDKILEDEISKTINNQYQSGITQHGNSWLFSANYPSNLIETSFELIRQLHYPGMPSRFQSVFGVDKENIEKMILSIGAQNLNFKIFRVLSGEVVKLDMGLLKGANYITTTYFAHKYWSGESGKILFMNTC
jgi:hypothetical protein